MKTIEINSGFQRGGVLLRWNGKSFETIRRASHNTWEDDGDTSFSTTLRDDFQGAIVLDHLDGHTPVKNTELLGFSESFLNSPSPILGWRIDTLGISCEQPVRIDTMRDYLIAMACEDEILTDIELIKTGKISPSGEIAVELGYEWGCQASAWFAIYSPDGIYLYSVAGCGDSTPSLIIGTDGNWDHTSKAVELAEAQREAEEEWFSALDRGTLLENGNVLKHLRTAYKAKQNPLRSLRRKYGGTWAWYESEFAPGIPKCGGEIPKECHLFREDKYNSSGPIGWVVVWIP